MMSATRPPVTVLGRAIPGAAPRIRRVRSRVEDSIQIGIVDYLRMVLPRGEFRSFAIPNGAGKLSPRAGKRLKDMGLLAGVPDIEILGRGGQSWFLEVKTDDGRPSEPQREFQRFCVVNHVPHAIVRNIDDAKRALAEWGIGTREAA